MPVRSISLKSAYKIYFVTVMYEEKIYCFGSGLGFTDVVYGYAIAKDEEEAERLTRKKYSDDPELPAIKRIKISESFNQRINSFYFPAQMAGYSKAVVSA